jgi:hypothetical protein
MLLLFADGGQLQAYLDEKKFAVGARCATLSLEQLASLTRLFYGGRAAPDFERAPRQQVRSALDAADLIGEFWALPDE